MGIISQVKDGEYLITTYESGTVIREIDQTDKPKPLIEPEEEKETLEAKLDKLTAKMDEILKIIGK